jgi:hypothetical protein
MAPIEARKKALGPGVQSGATSVGLGYLTIDWAPPVSGDEEESLTSADASSCSFAQHNDASRYGGGDGFAQQLLSDVSAHAHDAQISGSGPVILVQTIVDQAERTAHGRSSPAM